jgi:hypothetical protein
MGLCRTYEGIRSIRFAHGAHPLAMMAEPPTGGSEDAGGEEPPQPSLKGRECLPCSQGGSGWVNRASDQNTDANSLEPIQPPEEVA